MGKIIWTDRVRNEVLPGVKEERNILHTIKQRKVNSTGYILRMNCLQKNIIERKIEGRNDGNIGRRCKQVPGDLKENRK